MIYGILTLVNLNSLLKSYYKIFNISINNLL